MVATSKQPELPDLEEDDLSAISYTTGTTGLPKGALWTQRGVRDALVHSALELDFKILVGLLIHANGRRDVVDDATSGAAGARIAAD